MRKSIVTLAALGSMAQANVAFASPLGQEQVSEGQLMVAFVLIILVTVGSAYFVWKFYPREDKEKKDK